MGGFAVVTSFVSGELSPKMRGRMDVSQYAKGCRCMRNMLVTPYGAAERRPGMRYVGRTKSDSGKVRLMRFAASADQAYVLELGHQYMRFFRNGEAVTSGNTVVELETPYSGTELDEIQGVQSADVLTLVHPNHPVMELRRLTETSFELAGKEYEYPPMRDPNTEEDVTITPSAVTGDITLTASKAIFEEGNEGGYFELVHVRAENEVKKDFSADGESDTLEVYGNWNFTSHGTWTGVLKIQRSTDGGTVWKDHRTDSSEADQNFVWDGKEEEEGVLYRIKMQDFTGGSCRCILTNPDYSVPGVVKITGVTDGTHASGAVIRKLGGTGATADWSEGAWSDRRGYPRAVAFYEERMIFAGTRTQGQTIWGSKTGDWDNFLLGEKDDQAIEFTLASDTVNDIRWILQHDALIIGTSDSEWTLSASSTDEALTASNVKIKRQSVYGSASAGAAMAGETVLFVQRGGRKIREFVFRWEKDGYASPDMTILAEHITESGIEEIALQQQPDTILWCLLGNGTLASLTYEREQEVIGWARHDTAGTILSICCVPEGEKDMLYLAVDRGGSKLIEKLSPGSRTGCYVDGAVESESGTAFDEVTGLGHLEGQDVQVLGDGAEMLTKNVKDGKIKLESKVNKAIAGLGYASELSPMPLETEMRDGLTLLRNKTVGEVRVRVYGTVGGEVRAGEDRWQKIISRDVLEDSMDNAILEKEEVVVLPVSGGYGKEAIVELRQRSPLPFNVTSIATVYEAEE